MKNKNLVLLLIGIISIATITMSATGLNKKPMNVDIPPYLGTRGLLQHPVRLDPDHISANLGYTFINNTGCDFFLLFTCTEKFDDGTSQTLQIKATQYNSIIPNGSTLFLSLDEIYKDFGSKPGFLTNLTPQLLPSLLLSGSYIDAYPDGSYKIVIAGAPSPCNCFIWIPDPNNFTFTINPC